MSYENTKSLNSKKSHLTKNNINECNVSKASGEIMLDRLSVGNEKEFPFINFPGS
tara:strand:- start:10471 stop:10635 length:165 start_codon:yes stop_codon:yes gene_type:complete